MNCRKAQRRLSEWIDSGCPGDAVGDHVACCSTCKPVAEQLQQIVQTAQQLPTCDAPPALFGRVLAADDERRRATTSRRGFGLLAGGLAAAAAVAVAVMILLPRQQAPRRVEQAAARPVVTPQAPAKQDPSAALLQAAQAEFQRAELHYQRAISRLREIATRDSGKWKQRRRQSYLRELMIIEQVVARSKTAARMASDDPTAQEMLYGAYRRQIRHMQDAILASHEVVR